MIKKSEFKYIILVPFFTCNYLYAQDCKTNSVNVDGKYQYCQIKLDERIFTESIDEKACKNYCINRLKTLSSDHLEQITANHKQLSSTASLAAPTACEQKNQSESCPHPKPKHLIGFDEMFSSFENATDEELCDRSEIHKTKLREKALNQMREGLAHYTGKSFDPSKSKLQDKLLAQDSVVFNKEMRKLWTELGKEVEKKSVSYSKPPYSYAEIIDMFFQTFEENEVIIIPDFEQSHRNFYNYSSLKKYLPMGVLPISFKEMSRQEFSQLVEHPLFPSNVDGPAWLSFHDIIHSNYLASVSRVFNLRKQNQCLAFMRCLTSSEYEGKKSLKKELFNLFHEFALPDGINSAYEMNMRPFVESAMEGLLSEKDFLLASFLGEGEAKQKACGSVKSIQEEYKREKEDLGKFGFIKKAVKRLVYTDRYRFVEDIFSKNMKELISDRKKESNFEYFSIKIGSKLSDDSHLLSFLKKLEIRCRGDLEEKDYLADPNDKSLRENFKAVIAKGFAERLENAILKQINNYNIVIKKIKQNSDCQKALSRK